MQKKKSRIFDVPNSMIIRPNSTGILIFNIKEINLELENVINQGGRRDEKGIIKLEEIK